MDIIYNNFVAAAFDMSSFALPLPGSGLPLLQLVKATVCPASAATRYGHYIRCVIIGVWPAVAVTREGESVQPSLRSLCCVIIGVWPAVAVTREGDSLSCSCIS